MKKLMFIFFTALLIIITSGCKKDTHGSFVLVKGGDFTNEKSNLYGKNISVTDFYISKYEITQKEWNAIMDYNPSKFKGDNLPVQMVSWYDCVEYCNKRSITEGLEPYYNISKEIPDTINNSITDSLKWRISINKGSNGYRLPTEIEWEYAASGGNKSNNYAYSGSNNIEEVAWYWRNSGDTILTGSWHWAAIENNNGQPKPIGLKKPNELGVYDMSGNVREWCEDWYQDLETTIGLFRSHRGGGWLGGEHACRISYRGKFEATGRGPDQGFRICRTNSLH